MRQVGELWSADRITVADEHLATASAAIAGLYPCFPWPRARSSRIFITCTQGEQHAFGARVLADLLALDGWEEVYFGADVPLETLAPKTAELNPRAIALSVTLAQNLELHGGRIWVEDNMPAGARFVFALPRFNGAASVKLRDILSLLAGVFSLLKTKDI